MSASYHITPLLTALFRAVLQASWQGALAIVLVLIVRRVLGARVPVRWHYLLWFLVLVRLLAPTSMLPRSPASLENILALARPFDRQRLPSADREGLGKVIVVLPPTLPAPPRVTPPQPPAVAVPAAIRSPWSWQTFAALAWLVGVVSLGFWLVACSLSLRRRVHRETVPAKAELSALWQTCCQRWLRRPAPPVLTAAWVQSPALVGWWRPTLLLPRQTADSFSTQDWEHVFAHEIAHLRWRDHWTQLLLLAAWCVHWFNPVVWLGLRRLRADRELAADEWVLRRLQDDRALAYGETLFKTLAHRSPRLAFQPGMVGISEDGAQMKQRLRRIAAFLPQRRIIGSLVGFAAVLALGSVVLGQGSPAPLLTPPPKEAIAHPTATPKDPGSKLIKADASLPDAHKHFVNGGWVLMADGSPLGSDPITVHTHYVNGGVSGGGDEIVQDGWFYLNVPHDTPEDKPTLTLAVEKRGCAVAFAGPFPFETLNKLDRFEINLKRGYSVSVQIVDEAGRPVPGALLRPYYPGPPMVELPDIRTDAAGSAIIEHVGEAQLNLRLSADGFQSDEETAIDVDPAQPCRFTLKPTQPLHGTVTAAASGKTIAGAVIKLGGVRGPHDEDHTDPKKAPMLTSADAQGHFTLASLRPDSRYYLFVEAPGYGGAYLRGVTLAQGELNVTLGPELMIRGKIIHAPPSVVHMGKVYLQYGQTFSVGENRAGSTGEKVDLEPVNGEADFAIGPFYKVYGEPFDPKKPYAWNWDRKPIGIYVDTWGRADFSIDELPISNFVFDLARKTDDRSPPESDAVAKPADTEGSVAPKKELLPIASPAPSPANVAEPTPAPKTKVIEIDATASTEDGAPLGFNSAEIHPSMIFGPSGGYGEQFFPSFNSDGTSPDGHSLMRIPSDASDVGIAVTKEGYAAAFAGPFSPPLEEKLKGLHFTLKKGFTTEVQMVDEAGQPIAGARLKCRYSKPLYLDFVETVTDDKGRATLAHVGAGLLDLLVRADGYQADEVDGIQLDPVKPYRWMLKKAHPLVGYVTASDGQPIAEAKIKLAGVRGPHEETYAGAPYAPVWALADAQGRFVLTSLRPDSRYFFFVDAPGFAGRLLSGIRDTQSELKIVLGSELFVRGKFLHIPTASINAYDNTFVFGYDQFFDIEGKFWTVGQQGRVNPKDGEADFTIKALYDNAVVIRAEDKEINLEAKELPKSDLVVDLTPEPTSNRNRTPAPSGVVYTLGTPAKH